MVCITGDPIPGNSREFVSMILLHNLQTKLGVSPPPGYYQKDTKVLSPVIKQLESEAHYSPPYSADIMNVWSSTSILVYICMAW
jgi:hypothetical protein